MLIDASKRGDLKKVRIYFNIYYLLNKQSILKFFIHRLVRSQSITTLNAVHTAVEYKIHVSYTDTSSETCILIELLYYVYINITVKKNNKLVD